MRATRRAAGTCLHVRGRRTRRPAPADTLHPVPPPTLDRIADALAQVMKSRSLTQSTRDGAACCAGPAGARLAKDRHMVQARASPPIFGRGSA